MVVGEGVMLTFIMNRELCRFHKVSIRIDSVINSSFLGLEKCPSNIYFFRSAILGQAQIFFADSGMCILRLLFSHLFRKLLKLPLEHSTETSFTCTDYFIELMIRSQERNQFYDYVE